MTPWAAIVMMAAVMLGIGAVSAAAGALVVLPPSQWKQMPWPERARLAFAARVATVLNLFALELVLPWVSVVYFAIAGFRPPLAWLMGAYLVGLCGPIAVAMFMAWWISPRRRPMWYWLAGCGSAILFSYPNTLVYGGLAIAILLLGHNLSTVLLLLFLGAGGMAFAAWGGGIWVAWMLGLARPALPRATHAADWAAERVGERAAAVFEILWPRVAVKTFIFSRYLVVTKAAAELLTDEELLALSIRELTFFKQQGLIGTLRVIDSAVIFFMLACTAIGATVSRNATWVGLVIGYSVAMLIRPLVRRAQLKADTMAANTAIDPASALRALERQYELNLTPVVAVSNRSRDAHLYDRMVAAGIVPAYPRPQPPSKARIVFSICASGGTCLFLSIAFLIVMSLFAGV
jgi:hypothetical protein